MPNPSQWLKNNNLLQKEPILKVDNASVNLAENARAGTIAGADADPTDSHWRPVTFNLVRPPIDDNDRPLFSINHTTGQISLTAAGAAFIDYETTQSYTLTIRASDSQSHDQTTTLTINLIDVNQAPVFTSGATGTIAENSPTTKVVYDANARDDGENNGTLTYSLAIGNDNDLFNINSSTGQVTFKVSPNFEAPGDVGNNSVYDITVHANDGTLDTAKAVAITVTNVNEITTLAVAFTDTNNNHTYEPGTDLLIASLLDTVDDEVLSVGDTIHWGTYPTAPDGSTRGTFMASDTPVTAFGGNPLQHNQHSDGFLSANTELGWVMWNEVIQSFVAQAGDGSGSSVHLVDGSFLVADGLSGPGEPDTILFPEIYTSQVGFLDVLVFF